MAKDKTLAQTYYETVEALKADGMSNADAQKKVAEDMGKDIGAIRGGIHQYKKKLEGGGASSGTRRGRRAVSVDDHIASARTSLEEALALIDREVDQAKNALDDAQARYDELTASVADRKAKIEKQIAALS